MSWRSWDLLWWAPAAQVLPAIFWDLTTNVLRLGRGNQLLDAVLGIGSKKDRYTNRAVFMKSTRLTLKGIDALLLAAVGACGRNVWRLEFD